MSISHGRTALYRVYDAEGRLLYIGISQNPDVRFGQHSQTKDWWGEVAERRVEWLSTRAEAKAAEKAAIQAENPYWNLNHAIRPLNNPEAERLYAEHRWNLEEARMLLPEVKERAAADLLAGSTPAELAKLTGPASPHTASRPPARSAPSASAPPRSAARSRPRSRPPTSPLPAFRPVSPTTAGTLPVWRYVSRCRQTRSRNARPGCACCSRWGW